jgi:broad specificity phosphatase PhoE
MTVRLILISHAATAATRQARFPEDEPLEAYGAQATTAAAGRLHRIDSAYRGSELRCLQTADALGLDATASPALSDLDLGNWRGRTLAEMAELQPAELSAWLADPDSRPHGGEALSALLRRVSGWLGDLPTGPARIAAVTHPAVIRAAVLHVLGAPPASFWRIDTAPLSQTLLSHHSGRWQLRETGHLLAAD